MTPKTATPQAPERTGGPPPRDGDPSPAGTGDGRPAVTEGPGGRAIAAPSTPPRPLAPEPEGEPIEKRPRRSRGWLKWAVAAAVALGIGLFVSWRAGQPITVEVVRPQRRQVTETVAASGRVSGRRETVVGAPVSGVVAELYVHEGDRVRQGQVLARIQNNVALAQVRQAEQALRTARAQLVQAAAGPRPSELNAARANVQEAEAMVRQRRAQLAQAQAAVAQAEARQELARTNLQRMRYLYSQGAIARQAVDQAEAEYRTAVAEVTSAREGVATARALLAAAEAALSAARAQLRTLEAGPRAEVVEVARQRVREAEAALQVARSQAQNAFVRAPFAGTVTEILAEVGAPVGPSSGVVRLVETGAPEIRVDVDESNLADLHGGQRAVITSSTFRRPRLTGRVNEIGARVNPQRGTVEVKIVPDQSPAWLRPGATVNVNIITAQSVSRLVVPRSAIRREGDRSVVLVVRNGRAVPQPVVIGPVEGDLVPVLEGLRPDDQVVLQADRVQPGASVRPR